MKWLAGLAAVMLTQGAAAPLIAQDVHKDSNLGFQIRLPAKWKKVPIAQKEQWIVAKYISKRTLYARKEGFGHTPEMKVILFPHEVVKDRGVKVKKGEKALVISFKNPYKNFEDWLKSNASGGYFPVSEDERTVNKIKVTCMEYRFEKNTLPRRAFAWIFHGKDADWAVYFEGLADHWRKLSPDFTASLKTFKFIKRTGTILRAGTSDDSGVTVTTDDKDLTPAQKAKRRNEKFDRELRVAATRLEKGWRIQKSKNYVAITHVDQKYTTRILQQAEAVRKWLDKNFGYISEVKAGRSIIRVCATQEEEMAFRDTSGWGGLGGEITTHKDVAGGRRGYESKYINSLITRNWLSQKNPELSWGMPSWLSSGINQVLSTAYVKGGRLTFKPDQWEKETLRRLAKEGKLEKPRKLLTATMQEFFSTQGASQQAGVFVRFLLKGPKKHTKNFIKDYMYVVMGYIEEQAKKDKAERAKKTSKEETEEEQEARYKARKQAEKRRLEALFEKAFSSWKESKWKSFERAYLDFAG